MKYIITSNSLHMKHKGMIPTEIKEVREFLRDLQSRSCRPCGINLQSSAQRAAGTKLQFSLELSWRQPKKDQLQSYIHCLII